MAELSRREREVSELVAEGLTNRQIAERLFIAERTAEYHVEQRRNKLGFHSRVQIAVWVNQRALQTAGPAQAGRERNHLPVQLSSFVGREAEVAELRRRLVVARLVTLTGLAGIGKTRLALQLADVLADELADGAWLVDLSPLIDPALVAQAVALALGFRETPGRPLVETLLAVLSSRRALVVLDNCEHVLDASASFAEALLRECPEVRLIATSRQPLHVPGEVVWRLSGLVEAERLFCERAALVEPSFQWTPAVGEVCRSLDGNPLAVELAAARVSLMSIEELRAGLARRLELLSSGMLTGPRRQRSLRAAVDWSYELLSPEEQVLFARLAVFTGGFRLEAADVVCGEGLTTVMWLVLSLADKSMLAPMSGVGDRTRFRLLETLSLYAQERLRARGEVDGLRRRHLVHYLEMAETQIGRSGGMEVGARQASRFDRLAEDLDNCRAALEWSRAHEPQRHLRLASALHGYWTARGPLSEGWMWLETALRVSIDQDHARAYALRQLAVLQWMRGDTEAGRASTRQAADLHRALEDWGHLARDLNNLALMTDDSSATDGLLEEVCRHTLSLSSNGAPTASVGVTLGRLRRRESWG